MWQTVLEFSGWQSRLTIADPAGDCQAAPDWPIRVVRCNVISAWWLQLVILLGFLPYLPYSEHMHLPWAPLAVFGAESPAAGQLPPALDREEVAAATPLGQFTWRMLLNVYSRAERGRCERVCPAHGTPVRPHPSRSAA